jgi:hypothetical protein
VTNARHRYINIGFDFRTRAIEDIEEPNQFCRTHAGRGSNTRQRSSGERSEVMIGESLREVAVVLSDPSVNRRVEQRVTRICSQEVLQHEVSVCG